MKHSNSRALLIFSLATNARRETALYSPATDGETVLVRLEQQQISFRAERRKPQVYTRDCKCESRTARAGIQMS